MDQPSNEAAGYSLHELEAQGYLDEACTRNLALHRPVTASSDDASVPTIDMATGEVCQPRSPCAFVASSHCDPDGQAEIACYFESLSL